MIYIPTPDDRMIGLALLGSGIFAKEAHLPAIASCKEFQLRAVYSRSEQSAQNVIDEANKLIQANTIDLYCDNGPTLESLLERKDIAAVIIALPILVQPDVITACLNAGKWVLSEKPIAKDMETANALIGKHGSNEKWLLAENWAHESAILQMREWIQQGKTGTIRSFDVTLNVYTPKDGKYNQTPWREAPEYQGGYLLDGGVHFAAGLRVLLDSDTNVKAAIVRQLQPHLPPCDTCQALLETKSGATGIFRLSFGTESTSSAPQPMIQIFGSKGHVSFITSTAKAGVRTRNFTVAYTPVNKDQKSEEATFPSDGVLVEVSRFAQVINDPAKLKDLMSLVTPAEALKDLKLIEDIINAGKQ